MPSSQDDAERISVLLMELGRMMRQKMFSTSKEQFNPYHLHALMMIKENEGITMREIATYLRISSPSATSFVSRLVKLGWIVRKSDPANRKLVRLALSSSGKKMIDARMHEHSEAMRNMFALLSTQDRKDFVRILERLHSSLATSPHS